MKHASFKKLQEIRVFFKGFCFVFCLFLFLVFILHNKIYLH